MNIYALLITGGLLYTVGDILCLKWLSYTPPNITYYFLALASYITGMLMLLETFKKTHIVIASMLIIIFNVVSLTIVSAIFYDKPINLTQGIGLAMAVGSLFLLK